VFVGKTLFSKKNTFLISVQNMPKKELFLNFFYKGPYIVSGQNAFLQKFSKTRFAQKRYRDLCKKSEIKALFLAYSARISKKCFFLKKAFCPQTLLGHFVKKLQILKMMH